MTRNSPYLIGLTGGIASGKSNIARTLREAGAPVIDADGIARLLTGPEGPALEPLREAFGEGFIRDGVLDRKALADLVFHDKEQMARLNALMHPLIWQEMRRQIDRNEGSPAILLEVPLLYETGWHIYCDEVWATWAPAGVRLRRLMRRDGLSFRQARARMNSQMSAREKARRADHVIKTTGSRQESAKQALLLWQAALRRAEGA
ncbi:MAG: dephospho-CoA kinase [Christensenellales bacterium]